MGAGGGSSDVVPHYTVSPLAGLEGALEGFSQGGRVSLFLIDDANGNLAPALEAAKAADAVIIMAGTIAEENADRATFETDQGVGVPVALGEGLDWYAGKPNRISSVVHRDEAQLNPGRNSRTLAMIEAVMSAGPSMGQKNRAGAEGQRRGGPPRGSLASWCPGPGDSRGMVPRAGGRQHRRRSALRQSESVGEGAGDLPHRGAQLPGRLGPRGLPGGAGGGQSRRDYLEGRYMGYRWYDGNRGGGCALRPNGENPCVAFLWPWSELHHLLPDALRPARWENGVLKLETTVTNRGGRAGAEVVQVYLGL